MQWKNIEMYLQRQDAYYCGQVCRDKVGAVLISIDFGLLEYYCGD